MRHRFCAGFPPLATTGLYRRGNSALRPTSLRNQLKKESLRINIGTADRPVVSRRGRAHQGSESGVDREEG